MEKSAWGQNVMLLMDNFGPESRKLYDSFRGIGVDCPVAVMEEDGFLPEDVTSVYGFFLGDFKNASGGLGRSRYFNEIKVPDYWEISGTNSNGKVNDLYRERGRIFYAEPLHRRRVKVVDWYDERGTVRSSDHYNRYGALYARTIFNAKGQKVNKSYFDADGREVIVENFVTHDIILNKDGKVKIFRNKTDFTVHFLERAGWTERRIFFNSLSTPFFVSERLQPGADKGDILFWQEPVYEEIPGNMQIILRGESTRTGQILVQKKDSYEKLMKLGADPKMVHCLGYVYPFARENRHGKDVLICTNSENVAHCHRIVKALPELHFHIAAITEMSAKLLAVGAYDNVTMYPGVKMQILDELFEKCDFYLDINHENEIVSAVSRAFLQNQLILGFRETLHNKDYIAEDHIYAEAEPEKLIADLRKFALEEDGPEQELEKQRKAALAETAESYYNVIDGL